MCLPADRGPSPAPQQTQKVASEPRLRFPVMAKPGLPGTKAAIVFRTEYVVKILVMDDRLYEPDRNLRGVEQWMNRNRAGRGIV